MAVTVLTVEQEVGHPSENDFIIRCREQDMDIWVGCLGWFRWFPRTIHHSNVRPVVLHVFDIDACKSKGISGYKQVTIDRRYKAPGKPLGIIGV